MTDPYTCPECGKPTRGDTFVCHACTDHAKAQLLSIASLLPGADDKRARRGSNWRVGTVGRAPDKPLPFDPRVTDVIAPFIKWLTVTARIIEQHTNTTPPPTPIHLVLWVRQHAEWVAGQEWAQDLTTGVSQAHKKFEQVFDIPPDRFAIGKCNAEREDDSVCQEFLSAPAREGFLRCPKCGTQHDVTARRKELLAAAGDLHVTVAEAVKLIRLSGMNVDKRMLWAVIRLTPVPEGGTRVQVDIKGRRQRMSVYPLGAIQEALEILHHDDERMKEVKRSAWGNSRLRTPS